ncbi:MAG TPA: hypothetical protein VFV37_04030 [Luteibaculaceae bacterium]|nr:hypothetical protein [Luteibaculaceae bacterium]
MKHTLTLVLSAFISLTGWTQHKVTTSKDWQFYAEKDGVRIETRYTDCHIASEGYHAQNISIRLRNTTNVQKTVRLYTDTYYNGKCSNCDHTKQDRLRQFELKPNETIEGECAVGLNNGLRVHVKWLDIPGQRVLDYLIISDITVNNTAQ